MYFIQRTIQLNTLGPDFPWFWERQRKERAGVRRETRKRLAVGRILRVTARESSVKFSLCLCAPRHIEIKVKVQSEVKVGERVKLGFIPKGCP